MRENGNQKPNLSPEECEKANGHSWIFKDEKYICEYCKKESDAFKELKDFENTLPKNAFSS